MWIILRGFERTLFEKPMRPKFFGKAIAEND